MKSLKKMPTFRIFTQIALLMLSASPALALAEDSLDFNCQVKNITVNPGTPSKSPFLGLELKCPLSTVMPEGKVLIWAPDTERGKLEQFRQNGQTAHYTMTSAYAGTLLKIDGRAVGQIDPVGARSNSLVLIDDEKSPTFATVGRILDRRGVPFIPRHECNKRNPSSPCFDVQDRTISFEQSTGNFFELTISQIGGFYSYGGWGDGYVRVAVRGLRDQGAGQVITLSTRDSAVIRAKFGLGAKTIFENPHSENNQFRSITIEDNGQNIRITTVQPL